MSFGVLGQCSFGVFSFCASILSANFRNILKYLPSILRLFFMMQTALNSSHSSGKLKYFCLFTEYAEIFKNNKKTGKGFYAGLEGTKYIFWYC